MGLKEEVEAQRELNRLLKENARLKAQVPPTTKAPVQKDNFRLSVSARGSVQVDGVCARPVALYPDQWQEILAKGPAILAFIEANKSSLRKLGSDGIREDLKSYDARIK